MYISKNCCRVISVSFVHLETMAEANYISTFCVGKTTAVHIQQSKLIVSPLKIDLR